jgi:hypothetical protein
MNSPAASSVITTRSDWQSCIFCMNKTYKKDGKLHKVESEERMKNILEAARHNLDHEIEFKVLHVIRHTSRFFFNIVCMFLFYCFIVYIIHILMSDLKLRACVLIFDVFRL